MKTEDKEAAGKAAEAKDEGESSKAKNEPQPSTSSGIQDSVDAGGKDKLFEVRNRRESKKFSEFP